MNSHKNPNQRGTIPIANTHVPTDAADNDNRVCARKRSFEGDRGEGLLKKLKQAYDSSLKERSMTTPDVDGKVDSTPGAQPLPTVSDEEIVFSDLAILTASGKVALNLEASSILDGGDDDHSTVVDEAWHLEDLFGPIDAAADSPIENMFGVPNDLFHFGLEADYPPPRNEKGEIVQFASVREAIQSIACEQLETSSTTMSRSENTNLSASFIQPASLSSVEQSRSGVTNARPDSSSSSSSHPVVLQDKSRSSPAMQGEPLVASTIRPAALPQDHRPRQFRNDSPFRAMLPPPPVPVIAIQPRRQFGLPHSVPYNDRHELAQRSGNVPPPTRPLHHPLSAPFMPYSSSRNDALAIPMPLVQNCDEPAVLTLTSFPFRIICVNKAFSDLTGRSHELIGYSFYELFVSESDHTPSMATTPTLLGLFNNDIVRVIIKGESRRRTTTRSTNHPMDRWVESYDSEDSSGSSIGSIGVEDEVEDSSSDTFCTIRVDGIPCDGRNMQYFSIKLSPLQLPSSNHHSAFANNNHHNNHSLASSSVIYLPMPCGGTANGLPPLQPRLFSK